MATSHLAREDAAPEARPTFLSGVRVAGLRLSDALLIAAILGLVLVVSLPRIEAFARTTNESDARWVTALLGERLLGEGRAPSADLPALVADDDSLEHRLRDARRLPETEILLFHGYYFRLDHGTSTVYAWPRLAGGTGRPAFAWRAGAGLFLHPNAEGRWSGRAPAGSPVGLGDAGASGPSTWRPIEASGI